MVGGDGSDGHDVEHFSRADAQALPRFQHELEAIGRVVMPLLDETPPDPRDSRRPATFAAAAGVSRRAFAQRKVLTEAAYLDRPPRRASTWGSASRPREVKAALGWDVIGNTLAGPTTPGTAFTLLHEHGFVNEDGLRLGLRARAAWAR